MYKLPPGRHRPLPTTQPRPRCPAKARPAVQAIIMSSMWYVTVPYPAGPCPSYYNTALSGDQWLAGTRPWPLSVPS